MEFPADINILYSIINMKLRDKYSSLSELCNAEDIDENILVSKLAEAGFEYAPDINQFR
ncbi:MAG: DUF4250 domain-containing protein [Bacteroidales bacterium]|nr:DUF4250 domain-containing protein [Bacteroidales bacterium]